MKKFNNEFELVAAYYNGEISIDEDVCCNVVSAASANNTRGKLLLWAKRKKKVPENYTFAVTMASPSVGIFICRKRIRERKDYKLATNLVNAS